MKFNCMKLLDINMKWRTMKIDEKLKIYGLHI
jgi:hypothetical protein